MTYSSLHSEGLSVLQRIAASQWTDLRSHDPGVTILEQFCYALLDLDYRMGHPTADLFARRGAADLPEAPVALGGAAVTEADVRKRAVGVDGVANAWVEPQDALPFAHDADRNQIHFGGSVPHAKLIAFAPCRRLRVQFHRGQSDLAAVARAVHGDRLVGEDWEIQGVDTQNIGLHLTLEVEAGVDAVGLVATVYQQLEEYLAPAAQFESVASAMERGVALADLFEGPTLPEERGVLRHLPGPRREVYESDIVRLVGSVSGVKLVRSIAMAASPGETRQRWAMKLEPGHVAQLAEVTGFLEPPEGQLSGMELWRASSRVPVAAQEVAKELARRAGEVQRQLLDTRSLQLPPGRDRKVAAYASILRHMPAAYGLRPHGLGAAASPERRAAALQLEAYLHLLDQVLANCFKQLERAVDLFSVQSFTGYSYASQPVDDLRQEDPRKAVYKAPYTAYVQEEPGQPFERRNRFVSHLLARFGEELGNPFASGSHGAGLLEPAVRAKEALLQQLVPVSAARGCGADLLQGTPESQGWLYERIRLKLGVPEALEGEGGLTPFLLIEHLLLRPMPEDNLPGQGIGQSAVPLFEQVPSADPWTGRVTYVLPEATGAAQAEWEDHVADTLLAETPAHLLPQLLWFDTSAYSSLATAWRAFLERYRAYRLEKVLGAPSAARHLRALDARDAVCDLLWREDAKDGQRHYLVGRTYPLRDLVVPAKVMVAPEQEARIRLAFWQSGVHYELLLGGEPLAGEATPGEGDGEALVLRAPASEEEKTFEIRATKRAEPEGELPPRTVLLNQRVHVQWGIDPEVRGELVDAQTGEPLQRLARLGVSEAKVADFAASVALRVPHSQARIDYVVVDRSAPTMALTETVEGNGEEVVLALLEPVRADVELALRATTKKESAPNSSALLPQSLSLRVRPNPEVQPALGSLVVDHGGEAMVRIEQPELGVEYQVYWRPVRARQYVFEQTESSLPVLPLGSEQGSRVLGVLAPPVLTPGKVIERFQAVEGAGDEVGNGVLLKAPKLGEDWLLVVLARKRHELGEGDLPGSLSTTGNALASSVVLHQTLAVAVRPNAGQPLTVSVAVRDGVAAGPWTLSGGQPGMFYQLFHGDIAIGRAAYFHRTSDEFPGFNRGIGELRIGVDLVPARAAGLGSSTRRLPADPQVFVEQLEVPQGADIRAVATHAITRLSVPLTQATIHWVVPPPAET